MNVCLNHGRRKRRKEELQEALNQERILQAVAQQNFAAWAQKKQLEAELALREKRVETAAIVLKKMQ